MLLRYLNRLAGWLELFGGGRAGKEGGGDGGGQGVGQGCFLLCRLIDTQMSEGVGVFAAAAAAAALLRLFCLPQINTSPHGR